MGIEDTARNRLDEADVQITERLRIARERLDVFHREALKLSQRHPSGLIVSAEDVYGPEVIPQPEPEPIELVSVPTAEEFSMDYLKKAREDVYKAHHPETDQQAKRISILSNIWLENSTQDWGHHHIAPHFIAFKKNSEFYPRVAFRFSTGIFSTSELSCNLIDFLARFERYTSDPGNPDKAFYLEAESFDEKRKSSVILTGQALTLGCSPKNKLADLFQPSTSVDFYPNAKDRKKYPHFGDVFDKHSTGYIGNIDIKRQLELDRISIRDAVTILFFSICRLGDSIRKDEDGHPIMQIRNYQNDITTIYGPIEDGVLKVRRMKLLPENVISHIESGSIVITDGRNDEDSSQADLSYMDLKDFYTMVEKNEGYRTGNTVQTTFKINNKSFVMEGVYSDLLHISGIKRKTNFLLKDADLKDVVISNINTNKSRGKVEIQSSNAHTVLVSNAEVVIDQMFVGRKITAQQSTIDMTHVDTRKLVLNKVRGKFSGHSAILLAKDLDENFVYSDQ